MKKIIILTTLSFIFIFAQQRDSINDSLKMYISSEIKTTINPPRDEWFSQDKFLHFYFCASIVGLSYHALANRLNCDNNQSKIFSVSFTAVIGLGKEIYDKKKKGHFSWKDLCWDGAGLTVGYFAFIHRY